MGLTYQSTGTAAFREEAFNFSADDKQPVIALAGNPNTGKSTLFNLLTGLRQHTGNWPGKTVLQSKGSFIHQGIKYTVVDLPGTYSLLANSIEEQVARDFICFAKPDVTVVVVDATCLERNLNFVLQVMEITNKVVVCVNLIDEARRKKIQVHTDKLRKMLGVPVASTAANIGEGIPKLLDLVSKVVFDKLKPKPVQIKYDKEIEEAVSKLEPKVIEALGSELNSRWVALRLLEGDTTLIQSLENYYGKQHLQTLQEVLA
ncbi:MAG: 50S ribosome-binding GTPase [Desulfotomaculum sp.]|nr:50S ribosome-binding GTPase [Desulfotomaculum sp.]